MPKFSWTSPDGFKFSGTFDTIDDAMAAFDDARSKLPQPPPGQIIHQPGRSYVTGAPAGNDPLMVQTPTGAASYAPRGTGLSVDTTGMNPGTMSPALRDVPADPQAVESLRSAFRAQLPPGTNISDLPRLPSDAQSRDVAAAALQMRRDSPISSLLGPLAPPFQGVSQNLGDEAVSTARGLTAAATGGDFRSSYNLAQEAQRQALAQQRADYPFTSTASELAGGLTYAPGLARALPAVSAGLSPAGRAGVGAGVGAGTGGVAGFGSGSGLEDRITEGKVGGLLGGILGAATPPAAGAGSGLLNRILNQFGINRNLRDLGLDPAAGRVLRDIGIDDPAFYNQARQNIQAAGPNAMLVDAGGMFPGQLDAAAQQSPRALNVAQPAINARLRNEYDLLNQTMDRTLGGPPQGIATGTRAIREAGREEIGDLYTRARAQPIDYASEDGRQLEGLFRRIPAKAVAMANEMMQTRGEVSRQIMATELPNGFVQFERIPDVTQVDYLTRALRTMAETGEGTGVMGGRTDFSDARFQLAQEMRRTLRRAVPEYGVALDRAADDISRMQAMELGGQMLDKRMTRAQVELALDGMGQAERDAVRQGIRSRVDDLMANADWLRSQPNQEANELFKELKLLNSRQAREKMAMVLGPDAAAELGTQLGRSSVAAQLAAQMETNARTAGRLAASSRIDTAMEPGAVGAALEGRELLSPQRAIQFATGRTPQDKLAQKDVIQRQIAEVLTTPRGQDAVDALDRLRAAFDTGARNQQLSQTLGNYAAPALGITGYQRRNDLLNLFGLGDARLAGR